MSLAIAGCVSTSGGDGTTSETTDDPAATKTTDPGTADSETTDSETTHATTAGPPPQVREVDPAAVAERGVPRSPSIESDSYEPFRGYVVGELPETPDTHYETPHVWVWNLTGEPTTVELTLTSGDAELLDVEAEFPPGEPLAVVFRDRRAYELAVRAGDRSEAVTVDPDRFWCNATGTDVLVRADGIETETISTQMACTTTAGGS